MVTLLFCVVLKDHTLLYGLHVMYNIEMHDVMFIEAHVRNHCFCWVFYLWKRS